MNLAGKKQGWTLSALGFCVSFLIVSVACGGESPFFPIAISFSYPLAFFLNGYTMAFPNKLKKIGLLTLNDFIVLVVPSVLVIYIKSLVLYHFNTDHPHNSYYLQETLKLATRSIRYASGEKEASVDGIGFLWILFAFFIVRFLVRIIHFLLSIAYKNFKNYNNIKLEGDDSFEWIELILLFSIAIVAYLFNSIRGFSLTFNLFEKSAETLLFLSAGKAYRKYQHIFDLKYVYFPIFLGTCLVWFWSLSRGVYLNMLTPLAVWKLSSLIASVCACFVVSMIVRQLCRNHFVLKFTALLGDHFIGMILISYLDGLMGNQWQTDYIWLNCLTGIFYFWALSSIPYIILHLTGVIKDRAYYSLCKHYKKGIDVFFYISLAIGLFARASWTELISSTFSSLADFLTQIIITASVVAVAFTFPCVKRKWVLIIELLIYLVDILFKINGGETVAFLTIMLLLGAAEKNSKWIMRIALTVELVLGIISYILSMNGFLPYNVISGGVTGLHEFGLSHPNAAGLLLLMICIMYVGLRDNSDFSNFLLDIAVIGFMLFFNYRYFSSVTSILCTGLLLVNVLLYRLFRFIGAHFQKFNRANNLFITILGFISYPLLLLISIIIPYSYYYRAGDYIGKNLVAKFTDPSTLTTRMKISFNALYNLPIRLFGDNYIENTSSDSYFNVDSFYVRLLTKYGILMTCSFLLLMVVFTIRCRKAQKFELILINCVMAVFGFAESSLLFFAYNPFILLVFSNLTDRKQSDRRVDRKRASHADSNQKVQD